MNKVKMTLNMRLKFGCFDSYSLHFELLFFVFFVLFVETVLWSTHRRDTKRNLYFRPVYTGSCESSWSWQPQ